MLNKILLLVLIIFSTTILGLTIRGIPGNPSEKTLESRQLREDGPLELSPERGRFALTFSILENNSFKFSLPIAKFATPDLGLIKNDYVSLFAPGVSFLVIPGYVIGKSFGISQVGSYSIIALFAILNTILISLISVRLGANRIAGSIGAIIFLFATPAFAYAVNLYQHHISTFLMLAAIYALLKWKNFWSLLITWFLCAASISIDYPNLLFMLPIGFLALGRIFSTENEGNKIKFNIKPVYILSFLGAVFPLVFFLWFNQVSYSNPLQFSGTIKQVKGIDEAGKPLEKKDIYKQLGIDKSEAEKDKQPLEDAKDKKEAVGFFKTRSLINGFYIHFFSPDRGIIYFTPIILFGIIGFFILYKINPQILALFISVIGVNVLLYSMWGDPWGGWAFGSRYLIPSYSLMAVFVAIVLTRLKKNYLFLLIFFVIAIYSIYVNSLGAITTSTNPPQVEVLNLEKLSGTVQKYTFERNLDYLKTTGSKSFIYNTFLKGLLKPEAFFLIISTSISLYMGWLMLLLVVLKGKKDE